MQLPELCEDPLRDAESATDPQLSLKDVESAGGVGGMVLSSITMVISDGALAGTSSWKVSKKLIPRVVILRAFRIISSMSAVTSSSRRGLLWIKSGRPFAVRTSQDNSASRAFRVRRIRSLVRTNRVSRVRHPALSCNERLKG